MSTDKILQKIRQEAEGEAAAILAAAQERAKASANAILNAAKERAASIEQAAQKEAEELRRRGMLTAELDARKHTLGRKREVLDEAFAHAEALLIDLPEERYEALMLKLVAGAAETGTESLRVAPKDIQRFQNGLMDKLNARLAESGKPGKLTLSPAPEIEGGAVVVGEKADVDLTVPSLIRFAREGCEREVAAILFGSEVG